MKKDHRELVKCLGLISQLGITLVTPILLCVLLGRWMDRRFSLHTTLVWLILGVLAGARSSYLMAKRAITPGEDEVAEMEEKLRGAEQRTGTSESCRKSSRRSAPTENVCGTGRRAASAGTGKQGPDEGDESND